MFNKKQLGFTLIELLVVIAILGILAAVGVPAYQGFQQKAKYNSAKANFTNAKAFIMAEISKCNGNDNKPHFYDALNNKHQLGGDDVSLKCPVGNMVDGRNEAMKYFRAIMWDKFKNPYNPKAGVVCCRLEDITAAKAATTAIDATETTLGFMSLLPGTESYAMRLQINIGNQTGDYSAATPPETLSQIIGINE